MRTLDYAVNYEDFIKRVTTNYKILNDLPSNYLSKSGKKALYTYLTILNLSEFYDSYEELKTGLETILNEQGEDWEIRLNLLNVCKCLSDRIQEEQKQWQRAER